MFKLSDAQRRGRTEPDSPLPWRVRHSIKRREKREARRLARIERRRARA